MRNWFSSDQHFFHKGVIEYCKRPFASVEEMNEGLIERWNAKVRPEDRIFVLGDFAFCGTTAGKAIISRLNGYKVLVKGNHDHKNKPINMGFNEMVLSHQLTFGGVTFNLSHYPYPPELPDEDDRYLDLRLKDDGKWLLHGHTHCAWKVRRKMINVGVDVWDYSPISEDDILKVVAEKSD